MIRRAFATLRHLIGAVVWGSILAMLSRIPPAPPAREIAKRTWKARLLEAGALFGTLAVIGFLVVLSGLIPIKASTGHWAITRWFLEFSMERALATQSIGIKVPKLDEADLVLRGATHYENACRPCHGAPDLEQPRVASAMTPKPSHLPTEVPKYDSAELFAIVKHGVKFTGMPAWPAKNRDDEVWAMVAFLRVLPGLDVTEYHQLALGQARPPHGSTPIESLTGAENVPLGVRERCARCHGVEGAGRGTGAFPKLAGQHAAYLFNSMVAYQSGRRHSGIMEPVVAGLTRDELAQLARYYAQLDPAVGTHGSQHAAAPRAAATASIARGRAIAHQGIPATKVPACVECHGPTEPHPRHEYPMLAGQYADYIVLQLELFKKEHRGGSPFAYLMHEVAPKLEPQQMRDVAAYYESLRRKPADGVNAPQATGSPMSSEASAQDGSHEHQH